MEFSGGNAAEGESAHAAGYSALHHAVVAAAELFFLDVVGFVGDNWADSVDDMFGREVVSAGYLSLSDRFTEISAVLPALAPHQGMALFAQLNARGGVDGVVDASVAGNKAAEQL